MHVVITGGAGFIGANLVRHAEGAGLEVQVVDDLSTGALANLTGTAATVHVGSVLEPDVLDASFAGADAIVHLAALPSVPRSIVDPVATHAANVTGTVSVLEAARRHRVGHVVVASSSSVYGEQVAPVKHEDLPARPLSPYAASKLAAESYALAYAHCYPDLRTTAFRFFNVYGPYQAADHAYAAVVPQFVDAALSGRPAVVHGDGHQSRDFTYVGSLCDVLCRAVTEGVAPDEPVNLAFGTRTTVLGLVGELEQVLGRRLTVEHAAARAGDVRHSKASSVRLGELFPDAEPVPLRAGLERTLAWALAARVRSTPAAVDDVTAPPVPAPRRPRILARRLA